MLSRPMGEGGLSGSIPSEVGLLTMLTQFMLASQELTGFIPTEIANIPARKCQPIRCQTLLRESNWYLAGFMDLSMNRLSGPIPSELGSVASLRELMLCS